MASYQRKLSDVLTQIKNQIASDTTLTTPAVTIGLSPQQLKGTVGPSVAIVTPLNFSRSIEYSAEDKNGLVMEGQVMVTVWHTGGLDSGNSDDYWMTDATNGVDTLLTDIVNALHFYDPQDGSSNDYLTEPMVLSSMGGFAMDTEANNYWGKAELVFDVSYWVAFS